MISEHRVAYKIFALLTLRNAPVELSMANFKSPLVATKSPHPSSVNYFFIDEN